MDKQNKGLALLLDSAPLTWTSQEDRHLLLSRELKDVGIQPVLIFSAPLKPEFEERFVAAGAVVAAVSYGKGPVTFYKELKRVIAENSVGLVHIIFFDYFSPVTWIVRATGMKRIVYEMQNSGAFHATSWKALLLRARTKIATAPMEQVIAISEFVKEQLVKAGIRSDKIIIRYLGVDTERFTPDGAAKIGLIEKFKLRPEEVILSTVSYLRPFKNPDVLVRACRHLKDRKVPVRLFVAGDGEMLPDLKQLSKSLDVEDTICWLGNVADPKGVLQASDMFLLASTGEAFGLVLAEAMACGAPVVGTRSGSLPEVVADGKTGLLVDPNDPEALANAIEVLANDPERRKRMAVAAVDRVKHSFNVEAAVANTLSIYKELGVAVDGN